MLKEEIGCAEAVYDIVQRFINDIGIPTIAHYERCAEISWKLPKSTQSPPPLSQHGILPKASPSNSSCFIYHGKRVIPIDNDFLTPSQLQLLTCAENEGYLKAELTLAKGRIRDLETDLADSRQREQELLLQIELLTNAGSASATYNLPHTPNRHRTLGFSQKSPQIHSPLRHKTYSTAPTVTTDYGTLVEAHTTPTPSPHNLSHTPSCHRTPGFSPKLPQVLSPLRHKTYSTAPTASATTEYGTFIETHNLDDIFPAIDLVHRKVDMYLWQEELRNSGVPEDLLPQLMALMSSYSNPLSSSPFV